MIEFLEDNNYEWYNVLEKYWETRQLMEVIKLLDVSIFHSAPGNFMTSLRQSSTSDEIEPE